MTRPDEPSAEAWELLRSIFRMCGEAGICSGSPCDCANQLDRFRAAGVRKERERIAAWHESQRPELSGPEYGLASESERRAMRSEAQFHQDCALSIREGETL